MTPPAEQLQIAVSTRRVGQERGPLRRRCLACGRSGPVDGADACIGMLAGVVSACCGHGDARQAYIVFADGQRVAGADALLYATGTGRPVGA